MAKKQIVSYSYACDVCGEPIPDNAGDGATRKVSWEGTDYVVDVCDAHASQLAELLQQLQSFVAGGRRSGGQRGRRANTASTRGGRPAAVSDGAKATPAKRDDLAAIRSWAQTEGHKVGDRGRIPAALIEAYEAATTSGSHGSAAPEAVDPEPAKSDNANSAPAAKRRPPKAASAIGSAAKSARKRAPRQTAAAANASAAPAATTRKRAPRKTAANASAV